MLKENIGTKNHEYLRVYFSLNTNFQRHHIACYSRLRQNIDVIQISNLKVCLKVCHSNLHPKLVSNPLLRLVIGVLRIYRNLDPTLACKCYDRCKQLYL